MPKSADSPKTSAITWDIVLGEEEELLIKEKLLHGDQITNGESNWTGLALSGGGIRSAAFSLGVLQYLAKYQCLRQIDYISTVSGGGYIGAWLTALIHRRRFQNGKPNSTSTSSEKPKNEQHKTPWDDIEKEVENPVSAPTRWIREHANYLTPRKGLRGDTAATTGLVLTNLIVSIAIVSALVSSIALLFLFVCILFVRFSGYLNLYPVLPDGYPNSPHSIIPLWPEYLTYPVIIQFLSAAVLIGYLGYLWSLERKGQPFTNITVKVFSGALLGAYLTFSAVFLYLFKPAQNPPLSDTLQISTLILIVAFISAILLDSFNESRLKELGRVTLVIYPFATIATFCYTAMELDTDPPIELWPDWLNSVRFVWLLSGLLYFLGIQLLVSPVRQILDRFRPQHPIEDHSCKQNSPQSSAQFIIPCILLILALLLFSMVTTYAVTKDHSWPRVLPKQLPFPLWQEGAIFFGLFYLFGSWPMQVLFWLELREKYGRFSNYSKWKKFRQLFWYPGSTVLAGAVGGAAMVGSVLWLRGNPDNGLPDWYGLIVGVLIALFGVLLTLSVHMLVLGRNFPPLLREWWHRVLGWLLVAVLVWTVLSLSLVLAPTLFHPGTLNWLKVTVLGVWLGSSVIGVIIAIGRFIGKGNEGAGSMVSTKLIPWVFASGLVLFAFNVTERILFPEMAILFPEKAQNATGRDSNPDLNPPAPLRKPEKDTSNTQDWPPIPAIPPIPLCETLLECNKLILNILDKQTKSDKLEKEDSATRVFKALLIPLGFIAVATFFYNINWHSLYYLYRNRLVRCFLGATNKAHVQNASGFDPTDDLQLADIQHRPLHIFCTTMNLTGSKNLAFQTRKAASFFFSPICCGYVLPKAKCASPTNNEGPRIRALIDEDAFACTAHYMTPTFAKSVRTNPWDTHATIGTATTISGAATAPSCGYHTSPPIAFLMGLFNVRLGRWCPNPKNPRSIKKSDPGLGVWWFVAEFLGRTTEESHFVFLSDGGHFDNTGLYELVRRKCQYIVVVDGEHDPNWAFEGLTEAVRKCRLDLNADIEIDPTVIIPDGKSAPNGHAGRMDKYTYSRQSYAVGSITYYKDDSGQKESTGILLYLKLSLPRPEDHGSPVDVLGYQSAHPDFPHQPTLDQWFDESQFESYRELGKTVARKAFAFPEDKEQGDLRACIASIKERSSGSNRTVPLKLDLEPSGVYRSVRLPNYLLYSLPERNRDWRFTKKPILALMKWLR